MRKILSIVAAAAASALCTPAMAADVLWLDSDHTAYGGDYATGSSLTFLVNGVNVRASAWSIDGNGVLRQASLGVWDYGLGVKYGNPDNSHTVDNYGTKDFVLFQFDRAVELVNAQFNTGWHNMYDTDATIGFDVNNLGWASPPNWAGLSQASQLTTFDLYGSGSAGNSGNSYRDINPSNVTGNMWLIGASFSNPDQNYDGFKIEKLTFNQPTPTPRTPLPEPSTWAMMLIGFLGLGGAMRSRRNRERPANGEARSAA